MKKVYKNTIILSLNLYEVNSNNYNFTYCCLFVFSHCCQNRKEVTAMSVDYKQIGARIKSRRRELKKTQEWLAEQLDVTVGYISQVERGVTKISLDTLAKLAGFLQADLSYFISGVSANEPCYMHEELKEKFDKLNAKQRKMLLECLDVILLYNTEP